jgi:hypothetical protein
LNPDTFVPPPWIEFNLEIRVRADPKARAVLEPFVEPNVREFVPTIQRVFPAEAFEHVIMFLNIMAVEETVLV